MKNANNLFLVSLSLHSPSSELDLMHLSVIVEDNKQLTIRYVSLKFEKVQCYHIFSEIPPTFNESHHPEGRLDVSRREQNPFCVSMSLSLRFFLSLSHPLFFLFSVIQPTLTCLQKCINKHQLEISNCSF